MSQSPGKMILLVNTEFSKEESENGDAATNLPGGESDIENLQLVFRTKFGFDFLCKGQEDVIYKNIKMEQWDHRKAPDASEDFHDIKDHCSKCLRCQITTTDFSNTEYVVFAVSSHGRDDGVQEILLCDNRWVTLADILDTLSDKNCKTLKDKKVNVDDDGNEIQNQSGSTGDNGDAEDDGNVLNKDELTGEKHSDDEETDDEETDDEETDDEETDDCSFPPDKNVLFVPDTKLIKKDFLIVYAVVKGKLAKTVKSKGGWMIHAITEAVNEEFAKQGQVNFLNVLTKAAAKVAEFESKRFKTDENNKKILDKEQSGKKNAICICHKLTRPVVFNVVQLPNPPLL